MQQATETEHRSSPSQLPEPAPGAYSRHTQGRGSRWSVQGHNLNLWCRVPGSPLAGGLILLPNAPEQEPVSVVFGPTVLPEHIDAFSVFSESLVGRVHDNTIALDVAVLDSSHRTLAGRTTLLRHGDERVATIPFTMPAARRICLRFTVSFEEFAPRNGFGSVRIPYVVGFGDNPLVGLFNSAGSDKGTEHFSGGGVPHCYALDYHRLFTHLRTERFNFLEVGLEDRSKADGDARDAPSLRAWRTYFPHATLYGFDINDFGFLRDDEFLTFRGDQSAPEDLERFVEEFGRPEFGVVLDDGSHASSHQQLTLAKLFPHVAPGGLYVIEDLNWQPFDEPCSTLDLLRAFQETGRLSSPHIAPAEARYLESEIAEIRVHAPNDAEFAVLRKRGSRERLPEIAAPSHLDHP